MYQSKVQRFPICPSCPTKYKLRVSSHNKRWKEYVQRTRVSMIPIFNSKNNKNK
jgi:hypothetical protein